MITAVAVFVGLLLARIAAFVALLPLLGGTPVPRTVKLGLTLALTLMWGSTFWEQMPACASFVEDEAISWLRLGIAVAREVLLGGVLGYALGLVLLPARIAGEFLSQEMGLTYGNMVSAGGDGQVTPLTVALEMFAGAVFLGCDGHHGFFGAMHALLQRQPVAESLSRLPIAGLVQGTQSAAETGMMLAIPVAVCLFLTTVILMLLARATSHLNLYTVGFPLRLGVGLVALLLLLPHCMTALTGMATRIGSVWEWLR